MDVLCQTHGTLCNSLQSLYNHQARRYNFSNINQYESSLVLKNNTINRDVPLLLTLNFLEFITL